MADGKVVFLCRLLFIPNDGKDGVLPSALLNADGKEFFADFDFADKVCRHGLTAKFLPSVILLLPSVGA